MGFDAFISYRRSNGYLMAYFIRDRLKEKGITCFLDVENDKPGRFDSTIKSAIQSSTHFILVLSPNALDRCSDSHDWIRKEIMLAIKEKKNIIPVMFDGFKLPEIWDEKIPKEIIKKLEHLQAVNGNQEYLPAMIDKIYGYINPVTPKRTLRLAVTDLVVIDSIMQGWNFEEVFREYNCHIEERHYKWSDNILKDLSIGKIDIAIYNRESCKKFNQTAEIPITILNDMCSSMGGRNFYILAKKSEWNDCTFEDFKKSLGNNTHIAVAIQSDQYRNLLYALDFDDQELQKRGVKILDYHSSQGLSLFNTFPNLLLVSGQNIRYLAQSTGEYFEIVSYDDLPQDKKDFFKANSMNALLVGPAGLEKLKGIDLSQLSCKLLSNFYQNFLNPSRKTSLRDKLSDKLNDFCDNDKVIKYIIDNILFETYRILE